MKKKIAIAVAVLAAVAAPTFAVAMHHGHDHAGNVEAFSCSLCKGTGHAFGDLSRGPCSFCKGTGFNGSY